MTVPPSVDSQLAVLNANVKNLSAQLDRMLESQERTERSMVDVAMVKKEQEHMGDSLRQLHTVAEVRGAVQHQLDKRLTTLEWWHKYRLAQPALVLTVILTATGYAIGFNRSIEDFQRSTTRKIDSLEFIVNAPTYEKAMGADKPTPTGKK